MNFPGTKLARVILFSALLVWCAIAVAEAGQGILRVRLRNRRVGDHRAQQVVRPDMRWFLVLMVQRFRD